jgi:hypothetical protein
VRFAICGVESGGNLYLGRNRKLDVMLSIVKD